MINRVIGVGASMGGLEALRSLAARLPPDFPAPILVVQHIGVHESILHDVLTGVGPLVAARAVDRQALEPGRIYVAPPDQHLLVEDNAVRLSHGAKENHTRPAIDPLFRSLALGYGPAAIGVVLSGNLDDGTAGLQAIKACGGVAVVQDPEEARNPSMPLSAMRYVDVDHCVSVDAMAGLLAGLAAQPVRRGAQANPAKILHEDQASLGKGDAMKHLEHIATPAHFVCPECQGTLWQIKDSRPARYRCHTGHSFTQRTLRAAQADTVDEALYSALRALQEEEEILRQVAKAAHDEGRADDARQAEVTAQQISSRSAQLREVIQRVPPARAD